MLEPKHAQLKLCFLVRELDMQVRAWLTQVSPISIYVYIYIRHGSTQTKPISSLINLIQAGFLGYKLIGFGLRL